MIPYDSTPDPSMIEEAIGLMRGGLGKAELEFVASVTAPIFWMLRDSNGGERIKNGSVFFLDAGEGLFAVTAAHVIKECMDDTKSPMFVQCVIGSNGGRCVPIHLGDRIIDAHDGIDIATLRITLEELKHIGCTALTGYQKTWPPRLPEIERGITYCGFPGNGRMLLAPRRISFGCMPMAGIVTSAHETCISVQIERDQLIRVLGNDDFPENFDFGGISGGPLIAIVQTLTIRSWMPAGVIFQGPNPSGDPDQSIAGLEIIRARPVHFINPDGSLDCARWQQSNLLP
jgi:hypothetical protein